MDTHAADTDHPVAFTPTATLEAFPSSVAGVTWTYRFTRAACGHTYTGWNLWNTAEQALMGADVAERSTACATCRNER